MRYSYSDEGLERIRWAGLQPADIMWALNTSPQVVRHHHQGLSLYARSGPLYLVIGLLDEDDEENWVVIGARKMDADEVAQFERLTGGQ